MQVNINDLCELLTDKYKVDFIVIDMDFSILSFSKGINRVLDEDIAKNIDIRDFFYELIGYENEFDSINRGVKRDFNLPKVYKNSFYLDIYIKALHKNETFVLFIEDVTDDIEQNRDILQDRNNNALLLKELSYKNNILMNIARKDSMTQLLNRLGLDREMDKLFEKEIPFVLFFMDLDLFKIINDNYGHHYGDIILQKVAGRLNTIFSQNAIIARYGGDEFIVISYESVERDYIEGKAKEIIGEISREYKIKDDSIHIGTSIGIVSYPKDADNKYDLLERGDSSMYLAKDSGRNQYYFY